MNESGRTGMFVALATVSLAVAFISRPAAPSRTDFDDSGERFFAEADPLDARRLEVITYDETTATVQAFEVASKGEGWVIPSHENYPADAEEHLAQAAASVLDLIKGPKASDRSADHEMYGVVDPMEDAADATAGVGTRVTITNASGASMADFIIGKTVKDSDGVRYVRVPGRDRVYTSRVDTTALTTRFQDWIEEDLLQLDQSDIREIVINDYTIDELNQRLVQGELVELSYEPEGSAWALADMSEGNTLADDVISSMKTALDDLKIIDVHRKPEGLSSELRMDDALQLDAKARGSLMSRGYYIAGGTLVSNQGESIIKMKDGVMYVLRFGEIALGDRAGSTLDDTEDAESESTGAARYLFVMAEFDPNLIDVPAAAEPAEGEGTEEDEGGEPDTTETPDARAVAIEAGRQRVHELNDRFADWYYVISDDVYSKVRLTRDDLVVPAEAETEG